jgi:hypothetical protein
MALSLPRLVLLTNDQQLTKIQNLSTQSLAMLS